MASSSYTRATLQEYVADPTINVNIGSEVIIADVLNVGARLAFSEIDFRSSKRISAISPYVFDDVFQYTAPTDIKDNAVIDLQLQAFIDRVADSKVNLVTPETFDRKKGFRNLLVALQDNTLVRKLLINIDVNDTVLEPSDFDTLNDGGGTWVVFGDSTNIVADTYNFISGASSLKFDLIGSGTTAGLSNSALTSFDITNYKNDGTATAWVYINDTTNFTNMIIRVGSSSSNYYSMTATTQSDGTAFVNGWNFIRFAFSGASITGSPTVTACVYVALYMTKSSGKLDDGYRFDDLQFHTGQIYNIMYYSKYPWQNTSGTYLENSTSGTDYLNVDVDEFDIVKLFCERELAKRRRDWNLYKVADGELYDPIKGRITIYKKKNPTERLQLESAYYII